MTRISTDDLAAVQARMPEEGLIKLQWRPPAKRCVELAEEWIGNSHLLARCCPQVARKWDLVQPGLKEAFIALASGSVRWPFYLWGAVGTGKSRAALAFCDRIQHSYYLTVDEVMDHIVGHSPPGEYNWRHEERRTASLVVLDELGLPRSGGGRDFDYSAVKQFVDWRECRAAIYISNHSPEKIGKLYDTRMESRLTSGTVFELRDRDRRRR